MNRILLRLKRFIKRYLKVKSETRQKPETGPRQKFRKIIMLLLAAGLVTFLYPSESLFYPLDFPRRGEIALDDIISPFELSIDKTDRELQEEREAAANAIPIIIEYDTVLVDSTFDRFARMMAAADTAARVVARMRADSQAPQAAIDSTVNNKASKLIERFPFMDLDIIRRLIATNEALYIGSSIEGVLRDNIYFTGVLADLDDVPNKNNRSVIIRFGKREIFLVKDKLLDRSRAFLTFRSSLKSLSLEGNFDVDYYYELGRHFIIPNLAVNLGEMATRQQAAMEEISPVKQTVAEGDVIVKAGSKITDWQETILKELYRVKEDNARQQGWYEQFVPVLARLVLVLAIFIALYLYLFYFQNRLYHSNPKIFALLLIYGLELILIYVVDTVLLYPIYLFPVAVFSILVTVLYDSEVGLFNTFILALLLGVLHRFNFPLVLVTVAAGTIACYAIQQVRRRSEFFRSLMYLAITYVILVYLVESFRVSPSEDILDLVGIGIINAVISPVLAIGILPVFESLFSFTTDITLLELSDLNHPLLKRLALEAPGTYHHCIIVGNLAEAAAKAIGANPLLARVGAYYHDIGKIEIPEYFVENQLGIKSRHESLTPTMSAIILASHVKKGRIMGEEADLPDEILDFIEEHHGTMTMTYFLNKARELGEENPSVDDFRYPGPKPQKRETAIVMLADSVEAASRTLADPKSARLHNLVQNIINDRFQSGELEECPLTLKDLAEIRESFVKILIGVFHQRVVYPKKEVDE